MGPRRHLAVRSAAVVGALSASLAAGAPVCFDEVADIAVTSASNPSSWQDSHRVSNPEWNGERCVEPSFVALPRSAEDVQRCLRCAAAHRVRVAVKGGGHSFGGYSTLNASEGFMMNMRMMSYASPVVKEGGGLGRVHVQAGARFRDVYQSFKASGEEWVVNGGLCPSVGVAGFTLGGGAGPAARMYGLGADGALSFRMVTADGSRIVDVNATSNPDLFWGLRGGGGGNFGVVTDLVVQVHAGPDLYSFGQLCFDWAHLHTVMQSVQDHAEKLPRAINVDLVANKGTDGICLWITSMEPEADTRVKLQPLVSSAAGPITKDTLKGWDCWWEGISEFAQEHGYSEYNTNPYYSKNCMLDSLTPELADTLKELTEAAPEACGGGQHFIGFGGKTQDISPDATAFAWRSSLYMVYTSCGYTTGNETSRHAAAEFLDHWSSKVFPFCNGGSYVNFIDPRIGVDGGIERYYGKSLPRLQVLARAWRPQGFNPLHFPLEIATAAGETTLQV